MKKITINAPVILSFSAMCVIAYALINFFGESAKLQFFSIYHSSLSDPATYFRGLGHVLGYDTMSELIEGLMMILIVGPLVEEKQGSQVVTRTIITVAIATAIVHCIFFPNVILLGANGVIYALIIMSSFTGEKGAGMPLTVILVAFLYLGQRFRLGYYSQYDSYTMAYVVESIIGGVIGLVTVLKK